MSFHNISGQLGWQHGLKYILFYFYLFPLKFILFQVTKMFYGVSLKTILHYVYTNNILCALYTSISMPNIRLILIKVDSFQ